MSARETGATVVEESSAEFKPAEQWIVDQLYRTLHAVDGLLGWLDIPYTMMGGTLLGAVRHAGLIPWDDDGDLGVSWRDIATIEKHASSYLNRRGFGITNGLFSRLMIYPFAGRQLIWEGNPLYPFTDIFPLERKPDGRITFTHQGMVNRFHTQYFRTEDFDVIERYEFGPVELSGVRRQTAMRYLDDAYGASWPTEAYRTLDHATMAMHDGNRILVQDFSSAVPGVSFVPNERSAIRGPFAEDGACAAADQVSRRPEDGSVVDRLTSLSGSDQTAWRVLAAIVDAYRIGFHEPFTAPLIGRLAGGYVQDGDDAEWDAAIAKLSEFDLSGEPVLMTSTENGDGSYRISDCVTEWFRPTGRVPAATWEALINNATQPVTLNWVGESARRRTYFRIAAQYFRRALGVGDDARVREFSRLLDHAGHGLKAVELLRASAKAGNVTARNELAAMLERHGEDEAAVEVLSTGAQDVFAREQIAGLRARGGLTDGHPRVEVASDGLDIGVEQQAEPMPDADEHHRLAGLTSIRAEAERYLAWAAAAGHHGAQYDLARRMAQEQLGSDATEEQRLRFVLEAGDPIRLDLIQLLHKQGMAADNLPKFGIEPGGEDSVPW
jgi:lipopolysaccharide cholinephosphotransferase